MDTQQPVMDLTSTWAEAAASNDFIKAEPVNETETSYATSQQQQQFQQYEKLQAKMASDVEEQPFTWNSNQTYSHTNTIKSEFISLTNPSEVPTLTCKSEYTPTFTTKPLPCSDYTASAPFTYTPDFNIYQGDKKELWEEDNSDDDELLDGEDREVVKQRRKLRKMNREKQKRSYLNDKFDELCNVLSLGRNTRVEKLTILTETIRHLEDLTKEHYELTQSTHTLRSKIHAKKTGVPCEDSQFAQTPALHTSPTELIAQATLTPASMATTRLDTEFCMDVDDLSLWDTGVDEQQQTTQLQLKHTLFAESVQNQAKVKLEGEDYNIYYNKKTEDMFAEDDGVDAFFNVDENFNPSDFSFTAMAH